jgi:serine/threonine protein kinase
MDINFDKIKKGKKLGSGAYGIVYAAYPIDHPSYLVAIKRNIIDSNTDFAGSIRELDTLNRLRHPNIISLYAVTNGDPFKNSKTGSFSPKKAKRSKDDKMHFILEYAHYDLHTFIHSKNPSSSNMINAMVQILLGLEFIHLNDIIHRDIKPANVLVIDSKLGLKFKICDFGLSKNYCYQDTNSPLVVTGWYRAPEICIGWNDYDAKVDVWAMGCVFIEMLSKNPFLSGVSENDSKLFNAILGLHPVGLSLEGVKSMMKSRKVRLTQVSQPEVRRTWSEILNFTPISISNFNKAYISNTKNSLNTEKNSPFELFIDLLNGMMQIDPEYRLDSSQCLNHAFFDGYKSYIEEMRKQYFQTIQSQPSMNIIDCIERRWAVQRAFEIFNNYKCLSWYTHRVLFQGIDIFDRYLVWAFEHNKKNYNPEIQPIETDEKGILHSQEETELRFMVCLYISIKFFSTKYIPISYTKLVENNENFKTPQLIEIAEKFENILLSEVLKYNIYRETIYEAADWDNDELDDIKIREILMVYGMMKSYTNITAHKLYTLFKIALSQSL